MSLDNLPPDMRDFGLLIGLAIENRPSPPELLQLVDDIGRQLVEYQREDEATAEQISDLIEHFGSAVPEYLHETFQNMVRKAMDGHLNNRDRD